MPYKNKIDKQEYQEKYYALNRKRIDARMKKWRRNNSIRMKKWGKKYYTLHKNEILSNHKAIRNWCFYRLTLEERNKIEEFQLAHPIYNKLLGKRLNIDHCHATGQSRGLLSWDINQALGIIERQGTNKAIEILEALIEFLKHPPAELVLGEKRYGLMGQARYKKRMLYGPPPGHLERKQ